MSFTTNLFAVILSLAMMLTGSAAGNPGEPAAPVSRTLTVSNVSLDYNGESVALNPTLSLGVMTDGEKAVYDFAVDSDGRKLLPFQLVADQSGLLLLNDNSDTTLKITAEEIDRLLAEQLELDAEDEDGEGSEVFAFLTDEFLPAYAGVFSVISDEAQLEALNAAGDAIFDETVDRGEGVEGIAVYDGEEFPVTTYEYALTNAQIGRLADAVYASNDALADYARAYFKLLGMLPEEAGLPAADSFEELFESLDVSLNVVESVAESGLTISDALLQMSVPGLDAPVEFKVHSVEDGENREAELSGEFDADGLLFEYYMEAAEADGASQLSLNLSAGIIGGANGPTAVYVSEDGEYEYEDEAYDDEDDEDVGIDYADYVEDDVEGDTDLEELFYLIFSAYVEPAEADGDTDFGFNYDFGADMADTAISWELAGTKHADGAAEAGMSLNAQIGDYTTFDFSCDLDVTTDPIEIRADGADAASLEDGMPQAMLASVTADALNLSAEESIQQLTDLFVPVYEEEIEETETDGYYDPDDADGRYAEPYDDGVLAFGEPRFTWLPDGYAVEDLDIDTQYDMADCMITNEETGDSIYVYFTTSYHVGEEVTNYVVAGDGSVAPVEGRLIVEENDGDSRSFRMDDGLVSMDLYPYSDDLDDADILRLITGIELSVTQN